MEKELEKLIHDALKEDGYDKDITTLAIVDPKKECFGSFIVKSSGVVSGAEILKEVYRQISPRVKVNIVKKDGEYVHKGDVIASITGRMTDILRGERVALNFLQKMSGIASLTDKYVEELKGTNCKILDTRCTTPLLRRFEQDAVVHGGGFNHRFNLSDQAIIKDYHIASCDGINEAVEKLRKKFDEELTIAVEVSTIEEYEEALNSDCDVIMLYNMSNELIEEACSIPHNGKAIVASGTMTPNRVRSVAILGVDYISINSLSHSAKALDVVFKVLKRSYK